MQIVGEGRYKGIVCTIIEERNGNLLARPHGLIDGSDQVILPIDRFFDLTYVLTQQIVQLYLTFGPQD